MRDDPEDVDDKDTSENGDLDASGKTKRWSPPAGEDDIQSKVADVSADVLAGKEVDLVAVEEKLRDVIPVICPCEWTTQLLRKQLRMGAWIVAEVEFPRNILPI